LGGNRKASVGTYIFTAMFVFGVIMAGVHLLGLTYLSAGLLSLAIIFLFILPSIIKKDRAGVSTNLNLLTTMLLGGFWHGASWNFIIWGALHGIALAVHKIWMMLTGKAFASVKGRRFYQIVAVLVTFHFVCFGWIFFKAESFDIAVAMINQIAYNFSFDVWGAFYGNYQSVIWMMLLAFVLHAIPDNYADKLLDRYHRVPLAGYITIFFLFVLLYGYFKAAEPVMPIYLQF
jgi:hypothetical protein